VKRLVRASLVIVALAVFPVLAKADCRKCDGRYCNSVSDLVAGNDGCRIWSETTYHVGTNGTWMEVKYHCDPVGESCTNLHTSLTVTPDFQQVGSSF
jgi:hypothetical protein